MLLVVFCVVTAGVVVYTRLEQTTLPAIIDICEIVVYVFMVAGCFVQLHEGRQLSHLLTEYRRAIGIRISKVRVRTPITQFNLVYIVAFVFVMLRSLVELGRLIYELVQGFPMVGFWHSLTYFVLYTIMELIPLLMYLFGIQVERTKEEIGESTIR